MKRVEVDFNFQTPDGLALGDLLPGMVAGELVVAVDGSDSSPVEVWARVVELDKTAGVAQLELLVQDWIGRPHRWGQDVLVYQTSVVDWARFDFDPSGVWVTETSTDADAILVPAHH